MIPYCDGTYDSRGNRPQPMSLINLSSPAVSSYVSNGGYLLQRSGQYPSRGLLRTALAVTRLGCNASSSDSNRFQPLSLNNLSTRTLQVWSRGNPVQPDYDSDTVTSAAGAGSLAGCSKPPAGHWQRLSSLAASRCPGRCDGSAAAGLRGSSACQWPS